MTEVAEDLASPGAGGPRRPCPQARAVRDRGGRGPGGPSPGGGGLAAPRRTGEPAGLVAHRRVPADDRLLRAEQARRRREETATFPTLLAQNAAPGADDPQTAEDDSLILLFLCCHPSLAPAAQIALTLRAVGGLTTAEIARAFLVSEATMTRRITWRNRQSETAERTAADRRRLPPGPRRRPARAVPDLQRGLRDHRGREPAPKRPDAEAIRLTRMLHRIRPGRRRGHRLLALMLLTDARRPARTDEHGDLVPMASRTAAGGTPPTSARASICSPPPGPHNPGPTRSRPPSPPCTTRPRPPPTDWVQIRALYERCGRCPTTGVRN